VFRTRALAQTHPLSRVVTNYVREVVAQESVEQPLADIGTWAGAALTIGYCLRKVEEVDHLGNNPAVDPAIDQAVLVEAARAIAATIRAERADGLLPVAQLVETLDSLIRAEIERRLDQWNDTITDEIRRQVEDYLAWWVVRGYSLRVAEVQITSPR